MSGLICPYCKREIDLFKKGGGRKAALELGVEFLGSIPLEPDIVKLSDEGKVFVKYRDESTASKRFGEIVEKIEAVAKAKSK